MTKPALVDRLEAFLDVLKYERNLSVKTQENYRRQIITIIGNIDIDDWSELSITHVHKVLSEGRKKNLSARSIALRLSALRTFCDYLIGQNVLLSNPAKAVQSPKLGKPLPKNLNVDEVNQLLNVESESVLAIRDRTMMELTYGCGLRLAELAALDMQDVQTAGQVKVLGKGSKERIIPVGKMALTWINKWLQVRNQLSPPAEENALFVSKHKRRISHRQIAKRMSLWAGKQALAQKVNPHKLRHSYATHMLESSGDLRAVQELLGHANLSTTQVYTHLDFQHLAKVYDTAHPRARKK